MVIDRQIRRACLFGMVAIIGGLGFSNQSEADTGCKAIALMDTHAEEDFSSVIRKGQEIPDAVLGDVDKNGRAHSYAEQGGYSYPASHFKILNCHVVKECDPHLNMCDYTLKLNNTDANSDSILFNSVSQDLSEKFNFDEASAGNGAYSYLHAPNSACGKAVHMIMSGHPELAQVVIDNGICSRALEK